MADSNSLAAALTELQEIAVRLRRECPWDRKQDERSIVPHTIEESYELAEAAHAGDDPKLLDELGDVLYQVYFLALLMEERGAGDLEAVARTCAAKLIRRHPHIYGGEVSGAAMESLPTDADTPAAVRANWDEIKRREDASGDPLDRVPENLPSLLYARKIQKRAGTTVAGDSAGGHGTDRDYELIGELLFDLVERSRELEVDPEIALRQYADKFRQQVKANQSSQGS